MKRMMVTLKTEH